MTKIIALTGQKGSGKTSLARAIATHHYYWVIPFARPIKIMIGGLLAFQGVSQAMTERMINGDLKEIPTHYLAGQTPRYAMQTLGTEWRNMIGENLWIDIWENSLPRADRVVVDDLRFPHEADRVHKLDGKIIRITRLDSISPFDLHLSETQISSLPVDLELTNSSSILNLLDELKSHISLD